MINSFKNYINIGYVKKKTPDSEEAKSLLEKAKNRLEYTKSREINDKSSQFVLEDAYQSIRESAQALMSVKGFKPYSHEATISFIKEFYSSDFNEDAKSSVLFAIEFIYQVNLLLKPKK